MKNIHVLATHKPSRLAYYGTSKSLSLYEGTVNFKAFEINPQYIYITNDEELKEGDYYLSFSKSIIKNTIKYGEIGKSKTDMDFSLDYVKKIILTTDVDLIKDGVQAIDDEFLEWFVKNPSCEEIKVFKDERLEEEQDFHFYELIIPKEEPKHPKVLSENGNELFFDEQGNLIKEEPKQETTLEEAKKQQFKYDNLQDAKEISSRIKVIETLEEAAIIYAHKSFVWPLNKQGEKQSIPPGQIVPSGYAKHQKIAIKHFTAGYKLAQERSYSEEEAIDLLKAYKLHSGANEDAFTFFEQFKKK
jgi:hypothetical protein